MQNYESGIVSEIHEGYVVVKTVPSELCSSCGAKSLCHTHDPRSREIKALSSIPLSVGDTVYFETDSRLMLKYSFVVYLLPVVALLGGIIGGSFIKSAYQELLSALCGIVAFTLAFLFLKLFYRKDSRIPAVIRGKDYSV